MSGRLPDADPAGFTPEQRELYDRFTSGPRAEPGRPFSLVGHNGRLVGPPAVWIQRPPLGMALEQLGAAVRFASTLQPRAREIAILTVAHYHRSEFELYAHTRAGRAAGLTDDDLAALAQGQPPSFTTDEERIAYEVTGEILGGGTLDDEAYARAVAALTLPGLVDLVTTVGYYVMLAIQLGVFGIRPP